MRRVIPYVNLSLMIVALALAVASALLNDLDKCPLYLLLGYVLWRLQRIPH